MGACWPIGKKDYKAVAAQYEKSGKLGIILDKIENQKSFSLLRKPILYIDDVCAECGCDIESHGHYCFDCTLELKEFQYLK